MAGAWKLQTSFDILQAAIDVCFALEMEEPTRWFCYEQEVTPALITYALGARMTVFSEDCDRDFFRKVILRKLADNLSELYISDPQPTTIDGTLLEEVKDDELAAWEEAGPRCWDVDESSPLRGLPLASLVPIIVAVRSYHNTVLHGLLFRLKEDGLFRELGEEGAKETGQREREDRRPWEAIPEGWEREAVKLWWEGLTQSQIAERLVFSPRTVANRFSELRRVHGVDIVPYRRDLGKLGIRW